MSAEAGRDVRIAFSDDGGSTYTAVAGARTDSLTINAEMIDITDKDDAGVRTLLDDIGVKSFACSVTGVLKDETLVDAASGATSGSALQDLEITVGSVPDVTFTGKFFITSFAIEGEQAGEVTFNASFESSGTITKT